MKKLDAVYYCIIQDSSASYPRFYHLTLAQTSNHKCNRIYWDREVSNKSVVCDII